MSNNNGGMYMRWWRVDKQLFFQMWTSALWVVTQSPSLSWDIWERGVESQSRNARSRSKARLLGIPYTVVRSCAYEFSWVEVCLVYVITFVLKILDSTNSGISVHFIYLTPVHHWISVTWFSTTAVTSCTEVSC